MAEKEFLELLRTHQSVIYKLVHVYANTEEDKKDLYQEILLQAWKTYPRFKADSKFSTWLYKVCLNTIFTFHRKYGKVKMTEISSQQENMAVEDHLDEKDQLHSAIQALTPVDRAIITLHLDGYNNMEIAEMMGMTANLAGVRLFRIRQQLAQIINML